MFIFLFSHPDFFCDRVVLESIFYRTRANWLIDESNTTGGLLKKFKWVDNKDNEPNAWWKNLRSVVKNCPIFPSYYFISSLPSTFTFCIFVIAKLHFFRAVRRIAGSKLLHFRPNRPSVRPSIKDEIASSQSVSQAGRQAGRQAVRQAVFFARSLGHYSLMSKQNSNDNNNNNNKRINMAEKKRREREMQNGASCLMFLHLFISTYFRLCSAGPSPSTRPSSWLSWPWSVTSPRSTPSPTGESSAKR